MYHETMGVFTSSRLWPAFLILGTQVGCNLYARRPPPRQAPAPYPIYADQRMMTGGFLPPRRPPLPIRPLVRKPTIFSAFLGTSSPQAFWSLPAGITDSRLPLAPGSTPPARRPSPGAALPFVITPPPHAQRLAPRPGCGYVNVGGRQIPTDCLTPDFGEVRSAGRSLLPDSLFRLSPVHAGKAELPVSVDHREDGTEGPVRNQHTLGACTGFSFTTAVDHALARWSGQPGHISVMHAWARYHYPSMEMAAKNNKARPLTSEEVWPYTSDNSRRACSWVAKSQCRPNCSRGDGCTCNDLEETYCGRSVDIEPLTQADAAPIARVIATTRLDLDKTTLMDALAKGQDVWFAMWVTDAAFDADKLESNYNGLQFVLKDFDKEDASSGHAMVLSGYKSQRDGTYFLIHNSWGESWGDHGYAWIHETTLLKNIKSAYLVEAEPWNQLGGKALPRPKAPSQCGAGLIADSVTGQCVPSCPDGGARHEGACPDLRDCPEGYVNLEGECVIAAPTRTGRDPATGVTWSCAPGGCSYIIPAGNPGCFLPWCSVSCPSPRFLLASEDVGYTCIE